MKDGGFEQGLAAQLTSIYVSMFTIAGSLADKNMYPLAFSISAVASLVGLLVYIFTQKKFADAGKLSDDPFPPEKRVKLLTLTFGSFFALIIIVLMLLYRATYR